MVPAPFSTELNRGADFIFAFQIRDGGNCAPLEDISTWTFIATLVSATGISLITPHYELRSSECVAFTLATWETEALAKQTGAILTIEAIRPDGFNLRLARGRVTII